MFNASCCALKGNDAETPMADPIQSQFSTVCSSEIEKLDKHGANVHADDPELTVHGTCGPRVSVCISRRSAPEHMLARPEQTKYLGQHTPAQTQVAKNHGWRLCLQSAARGHAITFVTLFDNELILLEHLLSAVEWIDRLPGTLLRASPRPQNPHQVSCGAPFQGTFREFPRTWDSCLRRRHTRTSCAGSKSKC